MKRVLCILLSLFLITNIPVYAAETLKWERVGDSWYLYNQSHQMIKGFKEVNGKTYYMDESGKMVIGWKEIKNKWYYFDETGAMYTNRWKGSYYLGADGIMAVDSWISNKYYVDENGKYVQGWKKIDNKWYYFASGKGNKCTGWIKYNDKWYFLNEKGIMITGFVTYNGNTYYMNEKGIMVTGWVSIDSLWYYFYENGKMVTSTWIGNCYLCADGTMATSTWIDDKYVGETGKYDSTKKRYEWKKDGSKWRYVDNVENTYVKSTWKKVNEKWYYFDDEGYMVTGWIQLNNKWYYLNDNGSMATGWLKYNDSWYLLGSNGVMLTGWQQVGGYSYYLYSNGKMAYNTTIDGKWLDSKGRYMQNYFDGILVVNKKHPLPAGYEPGEDPVAGAAIRRLIADMQALGYNIGSGYSGYRSYATQYSLYWNYVANYGQAEADTFSARPGYSEHQTGLAFDLTHTSGALVTGAAEANWIAKNAHKYGFIVRYPSGKEHITGYVAEPWHLRYIGSRATEIYQSGLTLEEFLGVSGGTSY